MAVVAEPVIDITDDRLAARNAVVLAVAQALAGGNNTVIVATTWIIASVLAPDPGLATLPISFMVAGMWLGTLPVGMLSKALRPALCASGRLRFRHDVRTDLMRGSVARFVLAVARRHAVRRPLCGGTSVLSLRRGRYRHPAISGQSCRVGACRRRIRRGARAADRHFHQGYLADLFVRGDLPRPIGVRGARRGRTSVPQHSAPACVAFARRRPAAVHDHCAAEVRRRSGVRPGELHHDEHDDDLGAAGDGHV